MEYRDSKFFGKNWAWPEDDHICWRFLNKKCDWIEGLEYRAWNLPREIINLIPKDRRNQVLQAGGNAGLYPKIYGEYFKEVHTFEPEIRWRECLKVNCPEPHIICHSECLGNEFRSVGLKAPKGKGGALNLGAYYVGCEGDLPMITIDSVGLSPDLIHLDIEGYEGWALEGAHETILRSRPFIVIETNGSGNKFGWDDNRVIDLIKSFNYEMIYDWKHDKAFAPLS